MKSDVIPIYKKGQSCILIVDKEINDTTVQKGSIVTIEAIELTDRKFAELDEIYLVDYLDMTFWVYQTDLSEQKQYTETEVRLLLNQCYTLTNSINDFNEQEWFEQIKKQ